MIAGPEEVRAAARRKVNTVLQHVVTGTVDPFFPMQVRVSLKPKRMRDISIGEYATATRKLIDGSKTMRGNGYTVHLSRRRSREMGEQDFPSRVTIDSLEDFVYLTDSRTRLEQTHRVCDTVRDRLPSLESWLCGEAKRLDRYADVIDDLVAVTDALVDHPMPDCYLRQLNVPVDTKFIEKHQSTLRRWLDELLPPEAIRVTEISFVRRYGLRDGLPHHLIRFLDDQLCQVTGFPCNELSLPMRTLANLPLAGICVFIVENRTNLLTLPQLENSIALGGVGDSVTRLRDATWLRECELYYWGDLDVDGFRMLANTRKLFPQLKSLLMDRVTYGKHESLAVPGNKKSASTHPMLTDEETEMLNYLSQHNLRLEQERISQSWVESTLQRK